MVGKSRQGTGLGQTALTIWQMITDYFASDGHLMSVFSPTGGEENRPQMEKAAATQAGFLAIIFWG